MALSTPFIGSGRFVAEREWTCSKHEWPQSHECDCGNCTLEWECGECGECAECATAEWRDVLAPDGTPKMREVSVYESMLMDIPLSMFTPRPPTA